MSKKAVDDNKTSHAPGSRDLRFGTDGYLIADHKTLITDMAVDVNQKFYLIGYEQLTGHLNSWISRREADGAADKTFNEGKRLVIPSLITGPDNEAHIHIRGFIFHDDGAITGVGDATAKMDHHYYHSPAAIRFNPAGEMDASFGHKGVAIYKIGTPTNISPIYVYPPFNSNRRSRQAEGDVLFLSYVIDYATRTETFYLVKIKSDGALDTTFQTGGVKLIDPLTLGTAWGDYVADRNGGLILAGMSAPSDQNFKHPVLVKFKADGELDPDFGSKGVQTFDVADGVVRVIQLHILPDENIALLVEVVLQNGIEIALMRRLKNGAADPSFCNGAPCVVSASRRDTIWPELCVDGLQRFILLQNSTGDREGSIKRYTPKGEMDRTFGVDGTVTFPGYPRLKDLTVHNRADLLVGIRDLNSLALLNRYFG